MPRSAPLQASFARGELSPRAMGRTDLLQYGVGLETCLNAIITPRGEFERRPGTRFVAATKAGEDVCLINFEVSDEESYVIEAGEQYFRFFANRDVLLDPASGQPVEVTTPYSAEEACALDWAQSADVLYLTHPNHPPRRLERTSATSFQLVLLDFSDGPYEPVNSDASCQVQHFAVNNTISFLGCTPLTANDVGRPIRVWTGTQWVWDEIASIVSPSQATLALVGNIHTNAPNFALSSSWRMGAFYSGNYPAHVVFHEDRLVFANTATFPQGLWMSKVGQYDLFSPAEFDGTVQDNSGVTAVLNDRQTNAINWILSMDNTLLAGTASGPWSISAGNDPSGLTPFSIRAFRQSGSSAAAIRPVIAGSSVLFAQRSRRKLLGLNPDVGAGRYVSPDLSVLSDHLLCEGLKQIDFQEEPYGIVWCLLEDGTLAGLTFSPREELYAWHRHELGGGGAVTSIQTIPEPRVQGQSGQRGDDLWMVVRRVVNGQTVHHVEHLETFWTYKSDLETACFVDGAASYSGSAVSGVTGADHLEGATVDCLADGWVANSGAVAGGVFAVGRAAENITLGYPYPCEGRLLDLNSGALNGASVSKPRHLFEAYVQIWRSVGVHSGPDLEHLKEFQFRNQPNPTVGFQPVESRRLRIARDEGGWERTTRFQWTQPWPLPLVVLSIALRVSTSDE